MLSSSSDGTNVGTVCCFFFKDNEEQNGLAAALCAVLHQFFAAQPHLIHHAVKAWEKNGSKIQHEIDELWRIFLAAMSDKSAYNTVCVLEALDEYSTKDRSRLIVMLPRFY